MAIVADLEMPAKQWTMTLQLETLALSKKVAETNMSDKKQPNITLTGQKKSTSNLQEELGKTIEFFWVHPQGKLLIFPVSSQHSLKTWAFLSPDPRSVLLKRFLALGEINPKHKHPKYLTLVR